jgi:hypothetical protein
MSRRRGRRGIDTILNLDSLVDVVTNTNGMLILLAVFTTLLAIGKAYTLSFPLARPTAKEPVVFECRDHRVVLVAAGGRYGDAYFVVPLGARTMLQPRDGTHGETAAELRGPGSVFRRRARAMDPETHYAAFIVRPDGFEAYRAAREALAELRPGVGVGWEPKLADWPLVFSSFGRTIDEQ